MLKLGIKKCGSLLAIGLLVGCHAHRPDVPADAAKLIGMDHAIAYRQDADALQATPADGESLNVEQAIRLALANDPRIQASLWRVRVAEAEANQVRLLPNPILTIDLRFPLTKNSNTAFEPTLGADLLSLLQKPAQIAAVDNRLRASASTALVTVLDVMAEVQEAYAASRSVDAEIENAQRRRQRVQKLRDISQKRLDAGEGIRLDVLTLDAQLMQAELDVADLDLLKIDHYLALVRLLGEPRTGASWKLSPWEPPSGTVLPSESQWIDAALLNRPEILARVWELRALGEDLNVASFLPLQGGDLAVHGERDPDWRVGPSLTVPLPIFDFGQETREKVKALRTAARHELVQQRSEIIHAVRLAYATYIHSRQTLTNAQERLLPLQQRQLDQARLAYQAGEANLATLLLAQNDLELTLSKILELQEKVTVARVRLQRAAGGAGVAERIATAAATQPVMTRPATGTKP